MDPQQVVRFWREAGPKRWFAHDPDFDRRCREEFAATCLAARAGRLDAWIDSADGALALMLLLDQLPRNIHRGTAEVYAADAHARKLAAEAIAAGLDRSFDPPLRQFFYTPFMHSEDLADQEQSVRLYASMGEAGPLKWARHHHDIVARFGRFPHRNAILGRSSTAAETRWLADGGFHG